MSNKELKEYYNTLSSEGKVDIKLKALEIKKDNLIENFKNKTTISKIFYIVKGYAKNWYNYYFDHETYQLSQIMQKYYMQH